VQQRTTATTTTLSNNNALSSLTTNTLQMMPKNPTTKAPTKAVSTVGPYQVQGGLKGVYFHFGNFFQSKTNALQ
jgi:hypothetical protein